MPWRWFGFYYDDLSDATRVKIMLEYPSGASYASFYPGDSCYFEIISEDSQTRSYLKQNEKNNYDFSDCGEIVIRNIPAIFIDSAPKYASYVIYFFNNLTDDQIELLAYKCKQLTYFYEIDDTLLISTYLNRLWMAMWKNEIEHELKKYMIDDLVPEIINFFTH